MVSVTQDPAAVEPEAHAGPRPTVPDFDIVPRWGYIWSAIAVVGVVVVVAINSLWPLMFVHVTFGAAWTIIDLFLGFMLGPILGRLSVPARIEFTSRFMPKMVVLMPALVAGTLAAGWQLSTHLGTNMTASAGHTWVVISMVVVGVMSVIALGLLEPANIAVLIEMKKPRPNPAVIERLMKRFMYSAGVLGAMQVATLVIMTKLGSL